MKKGKGMRMAEKEELNELKEEMNKMNRRLENMERLLRDQVTNPPSTPKNDTGWIWALIPITAIVMWGLTQIF
jgi:hypothetical protein